MMTTTKEQNLRKYSSRSGVAAVECAIVVPLLMLLTLGAIDVGQYANVYQKVSDASREGARIAAQYETLNGSYVQTEVLKYLQDAFSSVPPATVAAATQVTVTDADGNAIAGGDLSTVTTGSQLCVTVTLQYDLVRWISRVQFLTGTDVTITTKMRRE